MQSTPIRRDTKAWRAQVWLSFGAATTVCAIGLAWLPGADLDRDFMVMGYFFSLCSALALAKYVRDNEGGRALRDAHEADLLEAGATRAAQQQA